MKRFLKTLAVLLAMVCPPAAEAQAKKDQNGGLVTGCYHTDDGPYGLLKLLPDGTFEWVREQPYRGTWMLKKGFGTSSSSEVILLRYTTGKKERFRIFPGIGAIDIGRKPYLRKIACP